MASHHSPTNTNTYNNNCSLSPLTYKYVFFGGGGGVQNKGLKIKKIIQIYTIIIV